MDMTYWLIALSSAAIMIAVGLAGIPLLRRLNARQEVREEGPQSHRRKSGTPTMGGVLMMAALAISLVLYRVDAVDIYWLLFLVFGYALLGLLDDGIKAVYKRNLGLTARQKMLGQLLLAGVFCYGLSTVEHMTTVLHVPYSNLVWDLGAAYYALAMVVIVGTSNAVNLTDGLDGLAAGTVAVAMAAYTWIARMQGMMDVALVSTILLGICLGFLVFNYHPAKVFMGDTGSLALGAGLAGMALWTHTELLLIVIGGVFVAEALSVILQVTSYKTRGKRIFRMSPLHHHFELGGWGEVRVIHTFWLAAILCACVGVWLY